MSFGSSAPLSLGVEEELFLVDAETLEPTPIAAVVVPDPGPRMKHELFASVVEITTPVCATADEVLEELRRLRAAAAERAAAHGAAILAAGTHPTARMAGQPVTDEPLYRQIAKELGAALERQFVCGLHVHVSVPDEDTCLRALEGVLPSLPDVLASSANSPYVDGVDSGLRSAGPMRSRRSRTAARRPCFEPGRTGRRERPASTTGACTGISGRIPITGRSRSGSPTSRRTYGGRRRSQG